MIEAWIFWIVFALGGISFLGLVYLGRKFHYIMKLVCEQQAQIRELEAKKITAESGKKEI